MPTFVSNSEYIETPHVIKLTRAATVLTYVLYNIKEVANRDVKKAIVGALEPIFPLLLHLFPLYLNAVYVRGKASYSKPQGVALSVIKMELVVFDTLIPPVSFKISLEYQLISI